MQQEQGKQLRRLVSLQEENLFLKVPPFQESLQIVPLKTLKNVKFTLLREILREVLQSKGEIESSKQYFL
ncbi:hypothetical protein SDC9_207828 [bioreactor metagenome]|uniref:Uncharacterized protein n=1 Tax=bioreactor metagenome TaxID=1076179 RepID=A0A645JKD8_9ZZZZ